MAFCPQCGKQAVDVFCIDCLKEQTPLIAEVEPVTLTKCSVCDRIKIKNSWQPIKEFDRFFTHHLTYAKNAQILEIRFPQPVIDHTAKEFTLPVLVSGTVSKKVEPYEEEYEVHVDIQKEGCDRCSLANSTYFEGFLQLRNPKDEVIRYIEKRVQKSPDVFITKAEDVRGGVDFWFTDQHYLQPFVHELKKKFGGVVKTQSKLHGYDHQRSKKVYRLTCLLRLPEFDQGDVIETQKRLIKITQMGSRLKGFDLRRRKNTSVDCPQDDKAVIHEVEDVVLSSTQPKPMFLHPDTYQETPLAHQVDVEPGSTVPVVQDMAGKWFVAQKTRSES